MPTTRIAFLKRRGLTAVAPLVAGCVLLAGCGGSSQGSGQSSPETFFASGSALAASLVKQMGVNQPALTQVKVHCPAGPVKRYPVSCPFTAVAAVSVKGKHVKLPSKGTVRVAGAHGSKIKYFVLFH